MAKYADLKTQNAKMREELKHLHWCLTQIRDSFGPIDQDEIVRKKGLVAHGMVIGALAGIEQTLDLRGRPPFRSRRNVSMNLREQ